MPPVRVLVLDGHSRAALESVQSLGRHGCEVDVAYSQEPGLSAKSAYAVRALQTPPYVPQEAYLDWLRKCDVEASYRLIVPSTEASLLAARRLAPEDPLRRKMVLPGDTALDIALDKEQTADLARRLGIRVPAGRIISQGSPAPPAEWSPTVLKPASSKVMAGGRMITLEPAIVNRADGRATCLNRWLPHTTVIEQQYVTGTGLGIEMLYDRGRLCWYFAHQRLHEWPLTGGASTYRRSVQPSSAQLEAARALLDALSWHGVAMVEFKCAADGTPFLMEINPRLWGSLALSIDAGVDFPVGLLRIAEGRPPGPQPAYRVGYTTRHPEADIQWMLANLKANHANPLLLTQPRLRSVLEWLRPLRGKESWDHFDWHDKRITAGMLAAVWNRYAGAALRRLTRGPRAVSLKRRHGRAVAKAACAGHPPRRLLFLCYGNICRSPFAHVAAARLLPGCVVESAGFHPVERRSTPADVAAATQELGIDLSAHRSACVTEAQVARTDLIVLMDQANYSLLTRHFPEAAGHAVMLGMFGSPAALEIQDPYQQDAATIHRVLDQIVRSVEGLAAWIGTGKKDSC